jgi:hypothetical protein
MGTVHRLTTAADDVTLGDAVSAYLATLSGPEQRNTLGVYGRILRAVAAEFGAGTALDDVTPERFAAWFAAQWKDRAPSTWNVSLDSSRAGSPPTRR